jgi:hypothetical protein
MFSPLQGLLRSADGRPPFLLAAELIEGGQGTKASAVTTTILPVELTLRQSCGCPLEIAKGQQ